MLRLILDRAAAAVPSESMFLLDIDERKPPEELVREIWSHPRVELWALPGEPPAVPPGLSRDEALRFAVSSPFVAYAAREGKARWGDKTPAYLGSIDRLAAIWPDARFVVLVRDGRDVALSIMKVPFGANNVWAAARSWAHAIRLGRAAAARYPDRVLTLRYEDLVTRPDAEVQNVCAFLGLDYSPDVLAIEQTDRSKLDEGQAAWFTNVWAGVNADSVGRWRREMSPRDRRTFERLAGAELAELGYQTSGEDPTRTTQLEAPAYALHDGLMRTANFVRLRLVQERGREVRHVVRRKLARL